MKIVKLRIFYEENYTATDTLLKNFFFKKLKGIFDKWKRKRKKKEMVS